VGKKIHTEKTMKVYKNVTLIHWCEIEGEALATWCTENDEGGITIRQQCGEHERNLARDILLPTASEDEIINFLREVNDDEHDPDGTGEGYYWRQTGFGLTDNTATIEFRSGRGHLAVTTVIW
jgi:hypothetical protein